MVQRGTTPTHKFNTSVDLTSATEIYITYKQSNLVKIEKAKADCMVTAEDVSVTLTQADTLNLNGKLLVQMQIRAKFANGTAIASNIMTSDVGVLLKDGEI